MPRRRSRMFSVSPQWYWGRGATEWAAVCRSSPPPAASRSRPTPTCSAPARSCTPRTSAEARLDPRWREMGGTHSRAVFRCSVNEASMWSEVYCLAQCCVLRNIYTLSTHVSGVETRADQAGQQLQPARREGEGGHGVQGHVQIYLDRCGFA